MRPPAHLLCAPHTQRTFVWWTIGRGSQGVGLLSLIHTRVGCIGCGS